MGIVIILWIFIVLSIAFGDSVSTKTIDYLKIHSPFFMFRDVVPGKLPDLGPTFPLAFSTMFQLKFAIITPALITGSFAGRVWFIS